ncbi:hypothetical protein Tsubulata_029397 [Turnera subulata]|uniref:Uncharacterized protein n=1 Tax=Turnera subulata TaxID=218843 RepID=A0A9Q0J2B3_9ROSI|nr:hypothetical protein Tsubulata_029397 [Turnera subulata]
MERDFLGLSSKDSLGVVEEEVNPEGYNDIGFGKGLGIQWPFCNKVSSLPHVMSIRSAQEEKTKKNGPDCFMNSGFGSISSAEVYDPSLNRSLAQNQMSFNHARQGGTQFSLTAYPMPRDVHSVHHPHDVKMFPVSNHAISISMGNPFFKNHFAAGGPSSAMKPQLLGGVPVSAPHSVMPSIGSVEGHNFAITPVSKLETPKITSMGTGAATAIIPSAVPQARKASLARFLEKRKERAMNTAPYNLNKKSPEIATPEYGMTSSAAANNFFSPRIENNQYA